MPLTQETFNSVAVVAPGEKMKKKDKPLLKPLEKAKRGRKKKPLFQMTIERGDFTVCFE